MVKSVEKPKSFLKSTSVWGRTGGLHFERCGCQHANTSSHFYLCLQLFIYFICMYARPACSGVSDSATLWAVGCQALLSVGSPARTLELPLPPPGDLPDPGSNLHFLGLTHCRQILHPLSHGEDSILVYNFHIPSCSHNSLNRPSLVLPTRKQVQMLTCLP